jgi:hypothetical protein
MALDIAGQGGELRQGRRTLARLGGWQKAGGRVTFDVAYVNAYAAGLGPPTEIVLPVAKRAVRVYPVVGGGVAEGAVAVDLMGARTETQA